MGNQKKYFNNFVILIVISLINLSMSVEVDPADEASSALNLWKIQEKKFVEATQKDLILVLGTALTGKSTVSVLMTNIDDLAVERGKNHPEGLNIVDKNNHIDTSLASKTLVPALMFDRNANISYYDCPGFDDSRSLDHQITIAYFLKKVTTMARSLKLVFTVDYGSFTSSGTFYMDRLLTQAFRLIKDFDKFKDGIAMVVTKVNNLNAAGNFNTDTMAYNTIINYLKAYKASLEKSSKEQDIQSIKFIDILLQKSNDNSTYPKIGLFRRPIITDNLEANRWPFKTLPIYKTIERDLKKIIHENIEYVSTAGHDFGYSMTERTEYDVEQILEMLFYHHVPIVASKITNGIDKMHHGSLNGIYDLISMHQKLEKSHKVLSEVKLDVFPLRILNQLKDVADDLEINLSLEDKKQISDIIEQIEFLMKISKPKSYTSQNLLIKIFESKTRIEDAQKWYRFLVKLYRTISKVNLEINEVRKAVLELINKLSTNVVQPIKVKSIDFSGLARHINIEDSAIAEGLEIHPFELEALRFVLKRAPYEKA